MPLRVYRPNPAAIAAANGCCIVIARRPSRSDIVREEGRAPKESEAAVEREAAVDRERPAHRARAAESDGRERGLPRKWSVGRGGMMTCQRSCYATGREACANGMSRALL